MNSSTVVSIHDESADISKLKEELVSAGYVIVESGRRASDFHSIKDLPEVGVVLIDYSLPQLESVVPKVTEYLPQIPIIWLSDEVTEDSVQTVAGTEVISLHKPLSTAALIKVISYCTKSSQFGKSLHMVHVATQEVVQLMKACSRGKHHGNK